MVKNYVYPQTNTTKLKSIFLLFWDFLSFTSKNNWKIRLIVMKRLILTPFMILQVFCDFLILTLILCSNVWIASLPFLPQKDLTKFWQWDCLSPLFSSQIKNWAIPIQLFLLQYQSNHNFSLKAPITLDHLVVAGDRDKPVPWEQVECQHQHHDHHYC